MRRIEEIERKYGRPKEFHYVGFMKPREFRNLVESMEKDGRREDITLFILLNSKIVAIEKHTHPAGVCRAPSGGVLPDEDLESAAIREAFEETGLRVKLEKYLLRINATFICEGESREWTSHVFLARATGGELNPVDKSEIRRALLVDIDELKGRIRRALLNSGSGGLTYRVFLTDMALMEIEAYKNSRESSEQGCYGEG
ncbi:MAG: NUDIX hydrolase [Archaeoglobi archaeon]|nr:NUDIX hydrolase [Candidatus Mnemosynella sp.]